MKIIIYILALTIFGLSVYPCSDGLHCEQEQEMASHNHSEDEKDDCSPFCVCSCCSISINVPSSTFLFDRHIPLISQKLVSYDSNFYPSGFSNSIWQPPRFS